MIFELKPKWIGITRDQVWAAWKRIRQGGKGVGVDNVTIEMIEKNPRKYLYPVWNRITLFCFAISGLRVHLFP
jgi:hypothetical protein